MRRTHLRLTLALAVAVVVIRYGSMPNGAIADYNLRYGDV